jgi:hypothetical protein
MGDEPGPFLGSDEQPSLKIGIALRDLRVSTAH